MSALDVKIVRLPKLHVASAHGFGPSPEELAWEKLSIWAKEKAGSR